VKHLKKFNESIKSTPIDVTEDIADFKKLFSNKDLKDLDKYLNELLANNPTMTDDWDWYEVYETDDYGRKTDTVCVVKAVSKMHAKVVASVQKRGLSIASTGFFAAKKIDDRYIYELEKSINNKEKELSALKNMLLKIKGE
jgi:hypothetical protein